MKIWQWVLLGVIAVAGAAGAWWLLRLVPMNDIIAHLKALGPIPYFGALAVLPAFGAPVFPFYLGAAPTFGVKIGLCGAMIAIAVNIALSYVLARWVMHPLLVRLMNRLGYRIPVVHPRDHWTVALLLRITPGPPFFAQSYILGLSGIPFSTYFIVSVGVAWSYAIPGVIFGEGLMSGGKSQLIMGAFFFAAVIIAVRFVRRSMQRRVAETAAEKATATDVATTKG